MRTAVTCGFSGGGSSPGVLGGSFWAVAYVRKVRTTSGAVAVQVARKDNGRVVVLAHLGSAHTDAELGILLARAGEVVADGQQALDFEVSARAQSLTDVPTTARRRC